MAIDVVSPFELDAGDAAAWTRLQGGGPLASPFLSPHWPRAVAEAGGPDRTGARIAIVREGGRPTAFLSARVGRFTGLPVGAPLSDYQGLVAAPDFTIEPERLLGALRIQRLDFTALMTDAPALGACARGDCASHVIDLRAGYDAYAHARAAAGTDILKDCAKKHRKLAREMGDVVFTAESRSAADFDQLIAWKRAQYACTRQTDVMAAGWPLRLLRQLFERDDPEMRGVLFTLHVGGKLAAAHYALTNPKIAHAWFIAHDEALSRYSPGVLLIAEVIRWAASRGMAEVDLGPGDYRFKLSLASHQRPVAHGFAGRTSAAALLRGAEYDIRRAAEALPLGRWSELPGKAMRRMDVWRGLGQGFPA